MGVPLYPDLCVLAQRGRGLLSCFGWVIAGLSRRFSIGERRSDARERKVALSPALPSVQVLLVKELLPGKKPGG